MPASLEYSAKDDKFRLQAIAERKQVTLNLGRIISVEAGEAVEHIKTLRRESLPSRLLFWKLRMNAVRWCAH